MDKAGVVAGIVLAIIGLGLIVQVNFFDMIPGRVYADVWGAIILAIGVYLVVHSDREKQIEQVKERRIR